MQNKIKEIYKEIKLIRKLIRLKKGLIQAPVEHHAWIKPRIDDLTEKIGTDDMPALEQRLSELRNMVTQHQNEDQIKHQTVFHLRPLINHLFTLKKVKALRTDYDGLRSLKEPMYLYIPNIIDERGTEDLRTLFCHYQDNSRDAGFIRQELSKLFQASRYNPFPETTFGRLDCPVIHYNIDAFNSNVSKVTDSCIVTGLCPISGVPDEIKLKLQTGEVTTIDMDYTPLKVKDEGVEEIVWPNRPILGDVITIKNVLETAKSFEELEGTEVWVWIPLWEYSRQYANFMFRDYIEKGTLDAQLIFSGLSNIVDRYVKLVKIMASRVGYNGKLNIIITDEKVVEEITKIREDIDMSFISNVYGSWRPEGLIRRLYELLIIEHLYPNVEGKKTLHIEDSYEIWPNIHAIRAHHRNKRFSGNDFSCILHPSTPSIDLGYMRDFNAPSSGKLFLAEHPIILRKNIETLSRKFLSLVAPLLIHATNEELNDINSLRDLFEKEMIWINERLV